MWLSHHHRQLGIFSGMHSKPCVRPLFMYHGNGLCMFMCMLMCRLQMHVADVVRSYALLFVTNGWLHCIVKATKPTAQSSGVGTTLSSVQ